MNLNKISSYLNIARKAGKAVIGTDNIEKNDNMALLLCSDTLQKNGNKILNRVAEKNKIEILKFTAEQFEKLMPNINNCKSMGITDKKISSIIFNFYKE